MFCTPLFAACIKGNCENGWGTFVWDNEDQYEGVWQDGMPLWRNQGWGTTSGGQKAFDFGYDKIARYVNTFNRGDVDSDEEGFVLRQDQKSLTYINSKDDIPGRFLYDQEDVTDDYQVHIIYLLAKDSKDKKLDVKGRIEKIALRTNKMTKTKTKDKK